MLVDCCLSVVCLSDWFRVRLILSISTWSEKMSCFIFLNASFILVESSDGIEDLKICGI